MSGSKTEELDSLSSLEERITRAVELVSQLRHEKTALEAELERVVSERDTAAIDANAARTDAAAARAEAEAIKAQMHRATKEVDDLRSERKHVRTRIEKLLGQMDLLSGS